MSSARSHEALAIVGVGLAAWGILLFFENSFFAAGFYGVPVPSWAAWVGNIPIVWFNVIDTIAVALVVIAVVLSLRHPSEHRRSARGTRGSVSSAVLLVVFLVLLAVVLFAVFGLTFPAILTDLKHFLGG